jgi:hypothetical protein
VDTDRAHESPQPQLPPFGRRLDLDTVFYRLSACDDVSKPANAWYDLGREATHFCFERLELEHE